MFQDAGDEFGISVISVWEAILLAQKGRIATVVSPESAVFGWIEDNPVKLLSIDAEIAALSRTLAFEHEDPADRFIAATAFKLGCPLATVDSQLCCLTWLNVIPS